jgi:bifunctional non-homologous end joining protein LigD
MTLRPRNGQDVSVRPMLATAAPTLPVGAGWSYEFKWDGVRALAEVTAGRLTLSSRVGNDVTIAYPELATLGEGIDDALIDGEIVAFADGRPSFGLLQTRMHVRVRAQAARLASEAPVTFIAFDLLRLYGVELLDRPLSERRATLERLAADRPQWMVSPVFDDGPATETAAREHGLEGVVAKRSAGRYRSGARTTDWIKVKFVRRAEFVVVGIEADASTPDRLSSLLLGYYEGTALNFAGKVGSGLTGRTADQLTRLIRAREKTALETVPPPSPGRVQRWVEPDVVVEVRYSEWAPDGRLRHPVFEGVRDDKPATEVTRDG